MRSEPASALFTTAITESELLYGIALLPEGRRRQSLGSVVDLIFAEDLAGRVLPFDSAAAREFADIAASRRRAGSRFPKPTRASPPSPGPAAPPWRRETSGILSVAGWN
jgi:predicted nucleic acid-binding protein